MAKWTSSLIGLILGTWILGLWISPPALNGRAWTHEIFYVTGVLPWGLMAYCLVIACRPKWLERLTTTPMDALYVHHRVLGYWAVGLSFAHYFTKTWALPVIGLFSLPKAEKGTMVEPAGMLEALWQALRPIANTSAEWLTWILGIVCLLAMVRILKYAQWLTFHKLLSLVFLGLTLHCVRLMEVEDFCTPFGWLNIAITIVGSWAALTLLVLGPGSESLHKGIVVSKKTDKTVTTLRIRTSLATFVFPGQFVFIRYNNECHPFSVTESNDEEIELIIRHSGQFTKKTLPAIPLCTSLEVEGPYGHFLPLLTAQPQNWIAVGIGIAPFLSWLDSYPKGINRQITLHWCVRNTETEPLIERVQMACERVSVKLKIHDRRQGKATIDTLLAERPDLVAVCGGTTLAKQLRKHWKGEKHKFLVEHFAWRNEN